MLSGEANFLFSSRILFGADTCSHVGAKEAEEQGEMARSHFHTRDPTARGRFNATRMAPELLGP